MKNLLPHRVSLVDHMPSIMRQGSRNTCAAAAAVLLAEYRFGEGTRLSVQYLFAETAKREQEWIGRNIAALRSGEAPDAAFKAAYPTQMAELDLVREAAGAGSDEEKSFLDVFESCQNKRLRGQSLRRCLETLVESGVCRNSLWPYDPNAIDRAASELPDGTRDDARRRRIARRAVYILDSPGNVDEVKGLLCGLNGRLPAPIAVTLSAADPKRDPLGHALVVVGYEDDPMNPGEGWFLLQNSWGTEWGDGGYGKISYGEFSRRCVEAGALVVPRRRKLFSALTIAAALLLAGGVALVAALSGDCPKAGPDWWTDAPWTNGTLNVCADISKGAYDTCPTKLRCFSAGKRMRRRCPSDGACSEWIRSISRPRTCCFSWPERRTEITRPSRSRLSDTFWRKVGLCSHSCASAISTAWATCLRRMDSNCTDRRRTYPWSGRFLSRGVLTSRVRPMRQSRCCKADGRHS